ncbi:MAG: hypothetical protein IPJ97_09920 [Proteobacteria bacterium]|nr:hypothetical protein [Pseudomonadota bacterium]
MTKKINLPCNGSGGNKTIKKEADTITFETSGRCTFTGFNFTDGSGNPYCPPGFSNKTPSNGVGASVSLLLRRDGHSGRRLLLRIHHHRAGAGQRVGDHQKRLRIRRLPILAHSPQARVCMQNGYRSARKRDVKHACSYRLLRTTSANSLR